MHKWLLAFGATCLLISAIYYSISWHRTDPPDKPRATATKPVPDPAPGPETKPATPETSRTPIPEPKPAVAEPRKIIVKRGDTMMKLLAGNGVPKEDINAIVNALRSVYDPNRMQVGQQLTLDLFPAGLKGPPTTLDRLSLQLDPEQEVVVEPVSESEFRARLVKHKLETRDSFAKGRIKTSLYKAAKAAEVPPAVIQSLINLYSFDIDFQREIHPGDGFAILFERRYDEIGTPVQTGEIIWASMTLKDGDIEYTRFTPEGGVADYYNRNGKNVRKTLMRTPINGARLSSGYGNRRHPILGYTRMHRGVDFAAPKGVPILAAGNGVIEKIGRNGGYGNYIRIRHNSVYKTAYAHMSRFRKGLKRGSRVRQGATIGYVGSTGSSTGPHLHYEVIVNGRQTNPLSVRLPAAQVLKGKALKTFFGHLAKIDDRRARARERQVVSQ